MSTGQGTSAQGWAVSSLAQGGDPLDLQRQVTVLDLADRLLAKGVVISGEVTIAVADVDLIHLSLRALLASTERVTHGSDEVAG